MKHVALKASPSKDAFGDDLHASGAGGHVVMVGAAVATVCASLAIGWFLVERGVGLLPAILTAWPCGNLVFLAFIAIRAAAQPRPERRPIEGGFAREERLRLQTEIRRRAAPEPLNFPVRPHEAANRPPVSRTDAGERALAALSRIQAEHSLFAVPHMPARAEASLIVAN